MPKDEKTGDGTDSGKGEDSRLSSLEDRLRGVEKQSQEIHAEQKNTRNDLSAIANAVNSLNGGFSNALADFFKGRNDNAGNSGGDAPGDQKKEAKDKGGDGSGEGNKGWFSGILDAFGF